MGMGSVLSASVGSGSSGQLLMLEPFNIAVFKVIAQKKKKKKGYRWASAGAEMARNEEAKCAAVLRGLGAVPLAAGCAVTRHGARSISAPDTSDAFCWWRVLGEASLIRSPYPSVSRCFCFFNLASLLGNFFPLMCLACLPFQTLSFLLWYFSGR